MKKRDYKSYNILDEDIVAKEGENLSKIITEQVEDQVNYMQQEVEEKILDINASTNEEGSNKLNSKQQIPSSQNFSSNISSSDIKKERLSNQNNNEQEIYLPAYKRYYKQKERSLVFKCLMWIAKIIITLMILPLIGCIACAMIFGVGLFLLGIITCIGSGLTIIGIIAFMSTQISSSTLALGISIGITVIALGGIITIIFLAIIKWLRNVFKKYKRNQ